jgi:hypothetical protein
VLNRLTERQVPVTSPVADGLIRPLLAGMWGHLEQLWVAAEVGLGSAAHFSRLLTSVSS